MIESGRLELFGKAYDALLYWNITKNNNFQYYQYINDSVSMKEKDTSGTINISAIKKFLKRTGKTFHINFTGDDPLFIDNIIECLLEITEDHYASLVSNLLSPLVEKLADTINPDRITCITASLHFEELRQNKLLEQFLNNCRLLKEKGFMVHVKEIAHPSLLDKADEIKKIFLEIGTYFNFVPFKGEWHKKQFPQAYLQTESKKFGIPHSEFQNSSIYYWKGLKCNAGYNTGQVTENGDIYPCFLTAKKIGNIYNKASFYKELKKCPCQACYFPIPLFEPYLYHKAVAEVKEEQILPEFTVNKS